MSQWTNATAVAEARKIYLEAIRHAPDDYWLHVNFGEFLTSSGDFEQATVQWQQVIELLPHSSGYHQVGVLLALQGKLAEAESAFSKAVALYPSLPANWFQLGNTHSEEKKFELALQDYKHAWKLDPQNLAYCLCIGRALSDLNRRSEAIQYYRQALKLDPSYSEAHLALGCELFTDNKIPEAEHELEEAIRLEPTNVIARSNLGVILAKQGQFDGALRQFKEVLRLDPDNEQVRLYLDRAQALKQKLDNPKPGR